MSCTMQVIELSAPTQLAVSHRAIPETPKDGVLLKTSAVSICSTDISHFHGNLSAEQYPAILGHEYCGTVVDTGDDCPSSLLDQRLAYFGQTDFGGLAEYRALRPLFAGDLRSSPFKTGRYFRDDERAAAIALPAELADRDAPLIEPITAVLRSILSHPPAVGSRVLVLGGGPCGAIAGAILQNLHATKSVAVLENNPAHQDIARKNYADMVFGSTDELCESEDNVFDYVFDALPPLVNIDAESCPRRAAMRATKPGSKYVLYGASQTLQQFDTWLMLAKGITLSSAGFDVDHFPMHHTAFVMRTAKKLLLSKIIDPAWIMTKDMSFWKPNEIIHFFENYHLTSQLKTVILFDK
ncbi:alcohol dehydrogenase catalytic domain-containing protein [Xylophilus ampelinus]|uniref:L-iditol 2-dehydrogenase/threonine 3-dehydrogenase n=1 Tax=Xylophilus ampelinus TaxID=54067 RepID=A0A318SK54_9BURK|nr:alcohol dehydrogenase catalytic domain-containing protein [Xylophilus ampelinus]MCS4509654.1 alcohol dehydrogenase catalytic domain-containing protein [Xylophilus ampelinus]PYE78861.1 L-iditol 2-dehydrogenase/threonine 3-dehydrogenase [Xylophilus ampelinus]